MDSQSQLIVQYKWRQLNNYLAIDQKNSSKNYTIKFVWINANKKIVLDDEIINLSNAAISNKNKEIIGHFKAKINKTIQAGIWTLLIISEFNFGHQFDRFSSKASKSTGRYFESNYKVTKNLMNSKDALYRILNIFMSKHLEKETHLQNSRIIARTQFLIRESVQPSQTKKSIEQLKNFWTIKDFCLEPNQRSSFLDDKCRFTVKNCLHTTWSSLLPDPKSQLIS